jgi:hypothetical protein
MSDHTDAEATVKVSPKPYVHPTTGQESDDPFDLLDWIFGDKVVKGSATPVSVQEIGNALHPKGDAEATGLFEQWARQRSLIAELSPDGDSTYVLRGP